jgi:hypothetical protein
MNALSILNALWRFLRGHSLGQATVEYVSVVGTCAVVGLAASTHYGDAVRTDLRLTALDSFPSPKPGEDPHDFYARRNAEYDLLLDGAVDRALGPSAVPDAVANTPLPAYCD